MLIADSLKLRRAVAAADPDWLRVAADAGAVGFWHVDAASGILDCTPRCAANFGFPAETDVTLETLWSAIHPEDRDSVASAIKDATEMRRASEIEFRAVWPDGTVRWLSMRGCYVELDGRAGMVGTTLDDTDRRRVEELNRLITTNVAEGICFMDADGVLTYANPAAEKILGWNADELRGRVLHDVVHYKHPDGSAFPLSDCPLGASLTLGTPVTDLEQQWIHKDGHFMPVICSSTPIVEDGRITGAVVSLHDITERKQMEDALREASRAKDEFLATVSHELRTPMTAILGWSQLLKTMELTPELRVAVQQIELSAKAQATIVDDLIDVSRAITGKLRLHVARIEAVTVLNEAMQMVETTATAKRIVINRTVHCENATLIADRGRLHQIFWNLLSSAIKFTPEGGTVEARMTCTRERLTVTVTDNGIGIAPQFLPFVFDRFSQQSGATTRMHGGLGLGLAIVKQLVEMHGGTVSAASEGPGKGATFTIVLPRG